MKFMKVGISVFQSELKLIISILILQVRVVMPRSLNFTEGTKTPGITFMMLCLITNLKCIECTFDLWAGTWVLLRSVSVYCMEQNLKCELLELCTIWHTLNAVKNTSPSLDVWIVINLQHLYHILSWWKWRAISVFLSFKPPKVLYNHQLGSEHKRE